MYEEEHFFRRLTQLRVEKGVTARDMSLSLGLSESYINRVESKRMLPSMTVFFYICEYFEITPEEFFSTGDNHYHPKILSAAKKLNSMDEQKREHILAVIQDL